MINPKLKIITEKKGLRPALSEVERLIFDSPSI